MFSVLMTQVCQKSIAAVMFSTHLFLTGPLKSGSNLVGASAKTNKHRCRCYDICLTRMYLDHNMHTNGNKPISFMVGKTASPMYLDTDA